MNNSPYSGIDHNRQKRGIVIMSIIAVLIVLVFIVSMNIGYIRLSPIEVMKTLFGKGTDRQWLILFEFRLPRIVISVLIGAGLAVSGCIMQGVSRNPLADPGVLGINAGAGLMVMLFISFNPMTTMGSIFLLPLLALIGAGLSAILIYALAYKKNEGISSSRLILNGIAVAAGISSAMIVLTLGLDPQKYQFVAKWLAGSIMGTNWKFVLALLPWIVVLLPFVFYKARVMNVITLGNATATGLGTDVHKESIMLLAVSVALAGSSVAVSGGIGFVGLIAPHLARRLVGPKHQLLLPASALTGALLVIVADTIGRSILQSSEIPTGIVVAVVGAPYFLYLLSRVKK